MQDDLELQDNLEIKEKKLQERLARISALEQEVLKKETSLKEKEKAKKQMLLRLSPGLWDEIAAWAEEDFRSINGQVEFLLTECVRQHRKKKTDNNERNNVK